MAESIEAKEIGVTPSRVLPLWGGILISPIAWAIQLQALWLTSEYGCITSDFTWNHVVSVCALIVSAIGVAFAVSEHRKWDHAGDNSGPDHDSRRRFMSMVGLMSSALFTVLIIALWLPTLTGVPCGK